MAGYTVVYWCCYQMSLESVVAASTDCSNTPWLEVAQGSGLAAGTVRMVVQQRVASAHERKEPDYSWLGEPGHSSADWESVAEVWEGGVAVVGVGAAAAAAVAAVVGAVVEVVAGLRDSCGTFCLTLGGGS